MALSKERLEKFVTLRNKSGFSSNIQFMLDANECGFKTDDLGKAKRLDEATYEWSTPFGKLIEDQGQLRLI